MVLSPISSASSMPDPDEDETLYIDQVLNDDLNGSQRPSAEREDSEMLDLSFRDDYSYCSNTTEMFQQTFINRNNNKANSLLMPSSSQKCTADNFRQTLLQNQHQQSLMLQQRQISPAKDVPQLVRGMSSMPVAVLQQVLNQFSYKEVSSMHAKLSSNTVF
jgi:hypothetical protein